VEEKEIERKFEKKSEKKKYREFGKHGRMHGIERWC